MYRMYGMSRCQGRQGATNVQDVRYVAVPRKARSDECTGCTDRYLLLQYLHFHHPWWSYVAVPRKARSDECTGCTDRYLLLGNCSCIALLSAVHGSMQYLHFHHPWWSYVAVPWKAVWFVISTNGRDLNG